MVRRRPTTFIIGALVGILVAVAAVVWWTRGPSERRVRQTVMTTIQEEAPAAFLVTGTMDVGVTVRVDSSAYLTPDWLTYVLENTQPSVLLMLQGGSQAQVRVPGRVSYGFDVGVLTEEHITVARRGTIGVDLPALSVHSVEPDLGRLEVRTEYRGWMRVFPSDVSDEVRAKALTKVEEAFRTQAEHHLATATQPKINTARALRKMLTPPLRAAGIERPTFRIRVGRDLTLTPRDDERASNFQN